MFLHLDETIILTQQNAILDIFRVAGELQQSFLVFQVKLELKTKSKLARLFQSFQKNLSASSP